MFEGAKASEIGMEGVNIAVGLSSLWKILCEEGKLEEALKIRNRAIWSKKES